MSRDQVFAGWGLGPPRFLPLVQSPCAWSSLSLIREIWLVGTVCWATSCLGEDESRGCVVQTLLGLRRSGQTSPRSLVGKNTYKLYVPLGLLWKLKKKIWRKKYDYRLPLTRYMSQAQLHSAVPSWNPVHPGMYRHYSWLHHAQLYFPIPPIPTKARPDDSSAQRLWRWCTSTTAQALSTPIYGLLIVQICSGTLQDTEQQLLVSLLHLLQQHKIRP